MMRYMTSVERAIITQQQVISDGAGNIQVTDRWVTPGPKVLA